MSTFYNIDNKPYISVIVILIIIYTIFHSLLKRIIKKSVSNTIDKFIELNPSMLGEKSLEISDGNLICKSEKSHSEHKAKAIDNVAEKDGRIVLYIQKLNPVYVIPCSAFNSESEKNGFIKLIKRV
ncbi:YcxB family protein [Clostridium sp. CCUG 7971]|uniref:YcxB family protein n=1 Tax=Clostridium sp. CCUG 7971 TaxID=2811414 RepID=UPI001ABBDBB9|nr:YcxB family protein [Clostridium sp. CCUG 7971]MBO3444921.1 YcxB family protein [Clostridium sp. CCUG 7971]